MPRTIEKTVYTFDELPDDAREKVIECERQWRYEYDHDWHEFIYDDVHRAAEILGINIDKIYFTGFWSQGDGACFVGSYQYKKGSAKAIREFAPEDKTLHTIADNLQAIQRKNFYQLDADVIHRGHYYHELCTVITVTDGVSWFWCNEEAEQLIKDALRGFMQWIYTQLETEWEWRVSDETITEWLSEGDNEYYEDGSVHC